MGTGRDDVEHRLEQLAATRLSRRGFLGAAALAGVLAACRDGDGDAGGDGGGGIRGGATGTTTSAVPELPVPELSGPAFTLGVASGDPLADRVILWTRLAPDPIAGGGMPDQDVPVRWRVATDEGMGDVVAEGTAVASPAWGHSVHVDATGLEPGTWYWYRFAVGDDESPVGRTRTAPAAGATGETLRFAFASCQNWESGYFVAYRHMAEEDLDLVVHLGDYIYEYGPGGYDPRLPDRRMTLEEPSDLLGYRNRYAFYKSDPHLQAAHARFPWLVTWDDHEVDNNYAGAIDENGTHPAEFLARRAAAYQAYYEHLPVRVVPPDGPDLTLYRNIAWGGLADVFLLDTRQYRDDQACGAASDVGARCDEALEPERTMIGAEQERWLLDGLRASEATWKVLGQQTIMTEFSLLGLYNLDQWDGYPASRQRVLDVLAEVANPVVITGDIHASAVGDLKADFADPASAVVGTELVGTSITSPFPPDFAAAVAAALAGNPVVRYSELEHHGYVRCEVDEERWRADYRFVDSIDDPDAAIVTAASFEIAAGRPGVVRV